MEDDQEPPWEKSQYTFVDMKSELYSDDEINSILIAKREGVEDTKLPLQSEQSEDAKTAPPSAQSEATSSE